MAGPSSFVPSPSPVSPSKAKRRFSLEQANRTLPLVSRIVRDIVATHERITQLQAGAQKSDTQKSDTQKLGTQKSGKKAAAVAEQDVKGTNAKELEGAVDRLGGFVDELTAIGVELKDYQTGLIDFVGRHQGRDVYLCWKLGEASISHWHELHTGFAGRQPISKLEETE